MRSVVPTMEVVDEGLGGAGVAVQNHVTIEDFSVCRENDIIALEFLDSTSSRVAMVMSHLSTNGVRGYIIWPADDEKSESCYFPFTIVKKVELVTKSGSLAGHVVNQLVFRKRQLEARLVRIEDRFRDLLK